MTKSNGAPANLLSAALFFVAMGAFGTFLTVSEGPFVGRVVGVVLLLLGWPMAAWLTWIYFRPRQ